MEFSLDEEIAFVGCGDNPGLSRGSAYLVALDLTQKCKLLTYKQFSDSSEFHLISIIRRMKNENVLFLGTHKFIVIVYWDGDSFTQVNQIESISDNPTTDIAYVDKLLFAVNDDARGTVIHFDDHVIKNRDPKLNSTKVEFFHKRMTSSKAERNIIDTNMSQFVKKKLGDYLVDVVDAKIEPGSATRQKAINFMQNSSTKKKSARGSINSSEENHFVPPRRIDSDEDLQERKTPEGSFVYPSSVTGSKPPRFSIVAGVPLSRVINSNIQPKFFRRYQDLKPSKLNLDSLGWNADSIWRLDIEKQGSLIVFGSKNLNILTSHLGRHSLQQSDRADRHLMDIKALPNGDFFALDSSSSHLTKYSSQGAELKRLVGEPCAQFFASPYFNSLSGDTEDVYAWVSGPLTLSMVNTFSFEAQELPGVFQGFEASGPKVNCLASREGVGVASLITCQDDEQHLLLYSLKDKKTASSPLKEILKNKSKLGSADDRMFCMDVSLEGNILFLGGATGPQIEQSHAKLVCVNFSKNLSLIDELTLQDKTETKMAVVCMKRDEKRNVLYLGVYQDIYVVEWTESNLCILRCFDNIHSCSLGLTQTW